MVVCIQVRDDLIAIVEVVAPMVMDVVHGRLYQAQQHISAYAGR